MDICGREDLFFCLHLLLGGKMTSAEVMTLEEPVFLSRSENMLTLP